jgi:hypothetical protein
MAGKLGFYHFIRKVHLYAAFSLIGFVLMYFITGFVLTHGKWFGQSQAQVSHKSLSLDLPREMTMEELSVAVQDKFGIHAKRQQPQRQQGDTIVLEYFKPGHFYSVKVSPDHSQAKLKSEKFGLVRTLIGFHRMHGYGGGFLFSCYVFLMDLASIATILYAFTGIFLWYKLMRQRKLGALMFVLGLAYTFLVIYLFMHN